MDIVDDSKLLQLAAEPRRSLFGPLDRAAAMTPLVAVIAFLPGLFALAHCSIDEQDALWGLRALTVLRSTSLNEFVDPGALDDVVPLKWQYPLGSWLTAICLRISGGLPVSLFWVSYLATAGVVAMSFVLASRLGGPRLGLLVALLLSVNGEVLWMVQTPAPMALGLLLAMIAFWGYVSHIQDASTTVSIRLLLCGVSLGLCVLAAGPLALVAFSVLLVDTFANRARTAESKQFRNSLRWLFYRLGRGLPSLFVIGLTAFAVGGWWVLMMASQYGTEFLHSWYTGIISSANAVGASSSDGSFWLSLAECLKPMGWLAGLGLYGIWRASTTVMSEKPNASLGPWSFSLIWTGTALLYVAAVSTTTQYEISAASLLVNFAIPPLTILATRPIEDIVERRLPRNGVCIVMFMTGFAGIWFQARPGLAQVHWLGTWLFAILLTLMLGLTVWWLVQYRPRSAMIRTYLLRTFLLVIVALHAASGFATAREPVGEKRSLQSLRQMLSVLGEFNRCTIITTKPDRQTLHYLAQSLWPHAQVEFASTWDMALKARPPREDGSPERHLVMTWGAFDQPFDPGRDVRIIQQPWLGYLLGEPVRAFVVRRLVSNELPP